MIRLFNGQTLKWLRKRNGETQKQLGDQIKVSITSISFWECDKVNPPAKRVEDLIKHYDVSDDYFYEGPHDFQMDFTNFSGNDMAVLRHRRAFLFG